MNSFCAMNSLRMSFWIVPESLAQSRPALAPRRRGTSPEASAPAQLIVIDVVTAPRSMSANSASMSASDVTLTPHLPTSPRDSSWSGSRPISVGRSKATLRPVPPAASSRR